MAASYYLDESGNSGDLATTDSKFSFGNQQIFSLAAIGVDYQSHLQQKLDELKRCYRVQGAELKSSLLTNKTALIKDLVGYAREERLPILVEVVDKQFMIVANIVNTMILPPVSEFDAKPEGMFLRNVTADYIYHNAPEDALRSYLAACAAPSNESAKNVFNVIVSWLSESQAARDPIARGTLKSVKDSFGDFKKAASRNSLAYTEVLPSPDAGKRNKAVWMLPNLTSLMSIYARINQIHERRVSGITLYHDQQLQFDEIMQAAKQLLEGLSKGSAIPAVSSGDYNFQEAANLMFVESSANPGIQAADAIAGFVSRYVRDILINNVEPPAMARYAFHQIRALAKYPSQGINFVLPTRSLMALGCA